MNEDIYLIALYKLFFSYPRELSSILLESKKPSEVWDCLDKHILTTQVKEKLSSNDKNESIEFAKRECDELLRMGVKIIPIYDEKYPTLLAEIFDPPPLIFIKGEIPQNQRCISIVGARKYTEYGEKVAKMLANDLSCAGITIVSGLANGIDSFAMNSAIRAKGSVIGVLGCGIDITYPASNRNLYEKTEKNGVIITEFFKKTPPNAWNFPRRNRIISGISKGTVIVEASLKSGSLLTAYLALNQSREVFAVPGNILNEKSAGTNDLIKNGAKLVTSIDDILSEIYPELAGKTKKRKDQNILINFNEDEKLVYNLLINEPLQIDILSLKSRYDVSTLSRILVSLEMKGAIRERHGKIYEAVG